MTLRPEDEDVETLMEKLRDIGWKDGKDCGLKEDKLVDGYYFQQFFERKFKEVNSTTLSRLTPEEERDVIEFVKNELRNADEIKILDYLKYGIPVTVDKETCTFKLIDYNGKNSFFFLRNAKFKGSPENIKPDITLFVNGIPLAIIEVKRETKPFSYKEAITQIRRYEKYSPELFRFVQFAIAYGDEKRYTPTIPNWRREELDIPYFNWVVERVINGKKTRIEDILHLVEPERLLEMIKYFTFFVKTPDETHFKLVARSNQYRATKEAIKRINEYLSGSDKNRGLIWHWQGSGKTYTMFFITNYFLDLYYSTHPIVFFIVDRTDLERQHEKVLKAVEDAKFKTLFEKIENIERLHEIIKTIKESEVNRNIIPRGVFLTTIQKFQRGNLDSLSEEEDREITKGLQNLLIELGKQYLDQIRERNPEEYGKHLTELNKRNENGKIEYLMNLGKINRKNILILIDEAHRTQYGLLAAMRKACFAHGITFGFTGTPIFKHERNTFNEFSYPELGEYYLDVYFIADSIRDGFTRPISYHVIKEGEIKAEGIQIKLSEKEIQEFIKEYMKKKGRIEEELELEVSRKEIRSYINKARVILLNPERIEKMAEYIANRIEEDTENFKFKAMVVAVNRLACVRYKRALDRYLTKKFGEEAKEWSEVVMTYNYNDTNKEIIEYKEELIERRGKSDLNEINSDIQREFVEKENPRILIVTDMLLTGFDAPVLKVMYLDKVLYEHKLLQAIARVNRPYRDKDFGLIVDSVGLLEHLTKTMALYNMLAEEDIRKDFEENLFKPIEEKVAEFEHRFNILKEKLKTFKIGGEDISFDLDDLKNRLKTNTLDKAEFDAKVSTIALHVSSRTDVEEVSKVFKLLNEMKYLLKLYKALGAHPKKLLYVEDIETLAYLYYKIQRLIRGKRRKLSKAFWNELLSFIYSKTIIEEFKEVGKAEIDESLKKLVEGELDPRKARAVLADYYFELRNSLLEKQHDPIYREILEKLENLRLQWINRAINTKTFLAQLKALGVKKDDYDKKIEGKSTIDRILESITFYVSEQIDADIKLTLKNTRKTLEKILVNRKTPSLTPLHVKMLKKELLRDLILELKGVDERKLAEISDKIVEEFLVEELERL